MSSQITNCTIEADSHLISKDIRKKKISPSARQPFPSFCILYLGLGCQELGKFASSMACLPSRSSRLALEVTHYLVLCHYYILNL